MKVCLGIPIVGSVPGEAYFSHLKLAHELGKEHSLVLPEVVNVVPYDKARESIVDIALDLACDLLFFVDSDMVTPPRTFSRLYDVMKNTGAQMTVGHYYIRGYPYIPPWIVWNPTSKTYHEVMVPPEAAPVELESAGCACNLIDVKWCKEHLERPWFFLGMKDGVKYCAEDRYFCFELRKAGGKIVGVPEIRVGHLESRIAINDDTAEFFRAMHLKRQEIIRNGKQVEQGEILYR